MRRGRQESRKECVPFQRRVGMDEQSSPIDYTSGKVISGDLVGVPPNPSEGLVQHAGC